MANILKALGALLMYPDADLQAADAEIKEVIDAEPRLTGNVKVQVHELIDEISSTDLLELQERYVALFDRGRTTSLNLFEHVHGESRERGPAMVDLVQVYERAGFSLAARELPDYLPLMLEFLSQRPSKEAGEMLSDCAHILRKLGEALRDRSSNYQAVPVALLEMIGEAGLSPVTAGESQKVDPSEEKSLDDDWMDAPVVFGPEGAPDCQKPRQQESVIRFIPPSP